MDKRLIQVVITDQERILLLQMVQEFEPGDEAEARVLEFLRAKLVFDHIVLDPEGCDGQA
jgi:hypothetical protein